MTLGGESIGGEGGTGGTCGLLWALGYLGRLIDVRGRPARQ